MTAFQDSLVSIAEAEFAKYKGLRETQSPLAERVGVYWSALGRDDLDGHDSDVPWSAAFISYMVKLAGAGSHFPYHAQHSVYVYRTINDRVIKKKTPFWGFPVAETTILPGDVIGMNREDAPNIEYDYAQHHADYKSHCDIVVMTDDKTLHTIGGNVSSAVSKKRFVKKGDLWINSTAPSQSVFVVIRSFLP